VFCCSDSDTRYRCSRRRQDQIQRPSVPTNPPMTLTLFNKPVYRPRDSPQTATVPMAADSPRSPSSHQSTWSVIRVTTVDSPPRYYELDSHGRLACKIPRQKKRVLSRQKPAAGRDSPREQADHPPPRFACEGAAVIASFPARAPPPGGQ
jgi:hypothetical protein